METKFTKGKWELDRDFIYTELSEVICDIDPIGVSKKVFTRSKEEAISNAKLIAAAPGLIEACIKLKEWNDKYPPGRIYDYSQGKAIENELTSIVKMQFEAIKKATE